MKWALERAEEIADFGMGEVDVSAIPPRRLAELSRYGVDGKASLLRRHGDLAAAGHAAGDCRLPDVTGGR